jgi:hypothetical protein
LDSSWSADPDGNPWSKKKAYVWWDAGERKWTRLTDGPLCRTTTPACWGADTWRHVAFIEQDKPLGRQKQRGRCDAGRPDRHAPRRRGGAGRLYGADPNDGVGGAGASFLLLDEPDVYGFPPDPVVTTRDLPRTWKHTALAALGVAAAAARWCRRPSSGPTTAVRREFARRLGRLRGRCVVVGRGRPARLIGVAGAVAEQVIDTVVRKRLGILAEPLSQGRAGRYLTAARWSTRAGVALLAVSVVRRNRALDTAGGLALTAGSLFTRLGYFHAGTTSATDPRYTVIPQRERVGEPVD